jgi:RNA polymerase sigma factor (TIGR02999 family)
MSDSRDEPVAQLLERCAGGDPTAERELFQLVYEDLRARARLLMRDQPPGHTLQPTALVHEAWLRVEPDARERSRTRSHFLRLAASAMRSVLVDHARARVADKRGGGAARITLGETDVEIAGPTEALLGLDEALRRLADVDPELARVAEMRLFGGLEHHEIASLMSVSTRTVERAWRVGRAWLQRFLDGEDAR